MGKSAALHLARKGVDVILTYHRLGGGLVRDNAEVNAHIAAQTALGRVGLPEDIGGVIAALLSEDNRWINAQRIEASGGMFL